MFIKRGTDKQTCCSRKGELFRNKVGHELAHPPAWIDLENPRLTERTGHRGPPMYDSISRKCLEEVNLYRWKVQWLPSAGSHGVW